MAFPLAICYINGNYPSTYFNLDGVTPIDVPPELWWSSRERKAFEDGLPTSEYLELDLGRLRSFNFLNFDILQKPIDITVEYDVWGFESGIKKWQTVTRIAGERFDNSVSFTPNAANPWKNCQFYFTNVKGDLISARYLRLKFDRRQENWPNATDADTFPWSIDLKNLRTSRYVIDLNDTRGTLVQQGKVTAAIVDPLRATDSDVVTLIGIPSGVEVYHRPQGHNNESYVALFNSPDVTNAILTSAHGFGGATFTAVVNGEETGGGSGMRTGAYADVNEAGHALGDLIGFSTDYAFFNPVITTPYCYLLAVGDVGSVGAETTVFHSYSMNKGTGATANAGTSENLVAGDLAIIFVSVNGGTVVTPPAGLTLIHHSVGTNGIDGYIYTYVSPGTSGANWNPGNFALSASVPWGETIQILRSPSSTNVYVMDEGAMTTDPSPPSLEHGWIFNAAQHGA